MSTVSQDVADRIRRLMPREARWAYWQDGNGPMFIYNTERIYLEDTDDPAHGRFESAVSEPFGPGSRSGKAREWRVVTESRSLHDLRRDAKARAYRLYKEWRDTGRYEL